ncbi:MAG TPA: hypothetical protein VF395_19755, partial [Polyangiaceae bacterium]
MALPALPANGAPTKKKIKAKHGRHERQPEFPANAPDSKACATAALSPAACLDELMRRGVHFRKAD